MHVNSEVVKFQKFDKYLKTALKQWQMLLEKIIFPYFI